MAIVIFGDLFTFPEGNAATNRVYTYAKGFIENGINTHVICFENDYNQAHQGITKGIYYYHPFCQKKRSKYFVVRRWQKLKKFYNAFVTLKRIHKKDNISAIICYSRLLQTQFFIFAISKITKSVVILESSEHPLKDYQGNLLKKIQGNFKVQLALALFHGINCISEYLIDFYSKKGFAKNKMLLVPSTVDVERFTSFGNSTFDFEYILYCGELNLNKDGVDILIKSFARISDKYRNINLILIGSGSLNDEILLRNLVTISNIQNRVYFLGQITRTDVPIFMKNAKILALSRPQSIIADAGFPSKVTEYLAAGKPVVATIVGEIPSYLTDGKNAFLAQPGSVESFSDKLDFVLDNYEFAEKVAIEGKELTKKIFNYNFQTGRIIRFINSLKLQSTSHK